MGREIINTNNAPEAIGTYSQAVKLGNTVYLSGQIPLQPQSMELVDGDMEAQIAQVFELGALHNYQPKHIQILLLDNPQQPLKLLFSKVLRYQEHLP